MENESIYYIENNDENIKILKEKGFSLYYNRETGKLDGCEYLFQNLLSIYSKIDFDFDEEKNNFILKTIMTTTDSEINLKLVTILLDLLNDGILKKEIDIVEEPEIPDESGDENVEISE